MGNRRMTVKELRDEALAKHRTKTPFTSDEVEEIIGDFPLYVPDDEQFEQLDFRACLLKSNTGQATDLEELFVAYFFIELGESIQDDIDDADESIRFSNRYHTGEANPVDYDAPKYGVTDLHPDVIDEAGEAE